MHTLTIDDEPHSLSGQTQAGTRFLLVLAAYFLIQVILRVTSPAALDMDEAEQLLVSRQLQLGYGSQPPLYSWLQWLMFSAFGANVLALAVLKNLLLFGTYLTMFLTARTLLGITGGIAVSASLMLIPQIAWESQRDLTHSVLMTCIASATLWSYVALLRRPDSLRYAVFGLLLGLGLQSKYNFAIFALSVAGASLLVREHRQAVWNRKIWIAVAVMILSLVPHGVWLLEHLDIATTGTLEKMQGDDAGYVSNIVRGFGSMLSATLLFATPLWMVYGWIFWRYRHRTEARLAQPHARFFLWFFLIAFACIALLVLSGELAKIKGRWMQSILFLLPLAFFVSFPALVLTSVCRTILRAAALFAIIILAGLPARAYFSQHLRSPYGELSTELAQRFPQATAVVATGKIDAGNLYLHDPGRPTWLLAHVLQNRPLLRGDVLLIDSGPARPDWLKSFLDAYPSSVVGQQGHFDIGTADKQHAMSINYAVVSVKEE